MKFKLYFSPLIIEANDEQEAQFICETGDFPCPYVDVMFREFKKEFDEIIKHKTKETQNDNTNLS